MEYLKHLNIDKSVNYYVYIESFYIDGEIALKLFYFASF